MSMERLSNPNKAKQIIILVVLRDVVVISIIIIITDVINIIITIISATIIIIIINIIIISVIIIGVNNSVSVFDRGERKPNFERGSLGFGIGVPVNNDSGKLKEDKMAHSRLIFQGY